MMLGGIITAEWIVCRCCFPKSPDTLKVPKNGASSSPHPFVIKWVAHQLRHRLTRPRCIHQPATANFTPLGIDTLGRMQLH